MDTIKKLCERVDTETRRLILAAYYRGCADGLKVPRGTSFKGPVPAMMKNQAD